MEPWIVTDYAPPTTGHPYDLNIFDGRTRHLWTPRTQCTTLANHNNQPYAGQISNELGLQPGDPTTTHQRHRQHSPTEHSSADIYGMSSPHPADQYEAYMTSRHQNVRSRLIHWPSELFSTDTSFEFSSGVPQLDATHSEPCTASFDQNFQPSPSSSGRLNYKTKATKTVNAFSTGVDLESCSIGQINSPSNGDSHDDIEPLKTNMKRNCSNSATVPVSAVDVTVTKTVSSCPNVTISPWGWMGRKTDSLGEEEEEIESQPWTGPIDPEWRKPSRYWNTNTHDEETLVTPDEISLEPDSTGSVCSQTRNSVHPHQLHQDNFGSANHKNDSSYVSELPSEEPVTNSWWMPVSANSCSVWTAYNDKNTLTNPTVACTTRWPLAGQLCASSLSRTSAASDSIGPTVEPTLSLASYDNWYHSFGLLSAFTQLLMPTESSPPTGVGGRGSCTDPSEPSEASALSDSVEAVIHHPTGDFKPQTYHPDLSESVIPPAWMQTPLVNECYYCCTNVTQELEPRAPGTGHAFDSKLDDLKLFACKFKQRRMKLGVTQAEVGRALGRMRLGGFGCLSQSTICRFESLTLSHNNMLVLKPILETWLEQVERQRVCSQQQQQQEQEQNHAEHLGTAELAQSADDMERRRRRTSITEPEKRILEAYFHIQPKPTSDELGRIASGIKLKKSVVRVWFCNQRQKQKRLQIKRHFSMATVPDGNRSEFV